jgi:hypothetical protein
VSKSWTNEPVFPVKTGRFEVEDFAKQIQIFRFVTDAGRSSRIRRVGRKIPATEKTAEDDDEDENEKDSEMTLSRY